MVYAETPEEQLIEQAIEKRMRIRGKPKNAAGGEEPVRSLAAAGFAFELVSERVTSLATDYTDERLLNSNQ